MPTWPFSTSAPTKDSLLPQAEPIVDRTSRTPTTYNGLNDEPQTSSASDANERPSNHPLSPPRRPHIRSHSGTLPSIFNPVKRNQSRDEIGKTKSPVHDGSADSKMSPRRKGQSAKPEEGDTESGHCATCGSRVKWPKGIAEFRCTTCLMVNDLKVSKRRNTYQPSREPVSPQAEALAIDDAHDSTSIFSLQRVQSIVDECVELYLQACKAKKMISNNGMASPSSQPFPLPSRPSSRDIDAPRPILVNKQYRSCGGETTKSASTPDYFEPASAKSSSAPSKGSKFDSTPVQSPLLTPKSPRKDAISVTTFRPNMPTRKPPSPPSKSASPVSAMSPHALPPLPYYALDAANPEEKLSSRPLQPDDGPSPRAQAYRNIFKPLEDYIVKEVGNFDRLNSAFSSTRGNPRLDAASYARAPLDRSASTVRKGRDLQPSLSELDGKTLLLGDVAENGLWWTGRGEPKDVHPGPSRGDRSTIQHDGMVHSRSPCIDFAEVARWYIVINNAGKSWKSKWMEQTPAAARGPGQEQNIDEVGRIEEDFEIARSQVQRTLLKVHETLLRRPGQPLKSPNDLRFMLIILANPLLYSGSQTKRSSNGGSDDMTSRAKSNSGDGTDMPSNRLWDERYTFSIFKRICGLLAHQSSESHRYLIAWFSRYRADDFRRLVDLGESYITHRLVRQSERKQINTSNPGLIPGLAGASAETSAQLHAALGLADRSKGGIESSTQYPPYSSDWQIKCAARVMALLFSANKASHGDRSSTPITLPHAVPRSKQVRCPLLPTSDFYNTMVDLADLVKDFDTWESASGRFSFCQYPFLLSIAAKIRIMEHDARRQMIIKAREAFFSNVLRQAAAEQYLTLRVRRECLVEDSLKRVGEVVGTGQQEIKKELKVQFIGEEGLDAGGLRKEWFLLLIREIFEPQHGLFIYDEDSQYCYFNPHSCEPSDQYFLVGVLLGLAIYNSTILDVALPPFAFKKLLAAATASTPQRQQQSRAPLPYTLDDLAEYRPKLANGLRQLLEYDGSVEENLDLNFVIETERYGSMQEVELCNDGANRPVTNTNREEFVDLYIRYLLDTCVSRQFEPFKRGFFTVCGGNALSLFQPEEIELLIRGSDEPLDVPSLKAVAVYDNWRNFLPDSQRHPITAPADQIPLIAWFWELFQQAEPKNQRRLLGFVTGSDRIPALGATSLVIKVSFAGDEFMRFPVARTCFNQLLLHRYRTKVELAERLWRAVGESEGFGLK